MKKLLWIVPALLIITGFAFFTNKPKGEVENAHKTGIIFFEGTWALALEKAKKENKPIFVDFYAVWCGPCKLLKNETFVDKAVADYYNKNFINLSIDAERGEGIELAEKFYVNAYPTLYILNKEAKPVLTFKGYLPPKEFLNFGEQGFKKAK
jgi:thioredoxin-related protein